MMSDWLVEHSALSSTHRSNSPLLTGRNCQSQTFYKENSLLWATCSATIYTKIDKQIMLARSHNTITSINSINRLLNVKFKLLSSVLSCLINKPLLIICLVIFLIYLLQKMHTSCSAFFGREFWWSKEEKKTVSATNLRITDCTSKNNIKIRMKLLFKALSRAVF